MPRNDGSAELARQRGEDYTHTVGKILDYRAIAQFLEPRLNEAASLLDLPCGDGSLLAAFEHSNTNRALLGVDASVEQVAAARGTVPSATIFQADIFDLPRQLPIKAPCYVHIGFAFLNVLAPDSRLGVLGELAREPRIGFVGFEIQNIEHQAANYREQSVYCRQLAEGTTLRTWFVQVGHGVKDLFMEFEHAESRIATVDRLYDWSIDDCTAQVASAGWRNISVCAATYRLPTVHKERPSHWFVELRRS